MPGLTRDSRHRLDASSTERSYQSPFHSRARTLPERLRLRATQLAPAMYTLHRSGCSVDIQSPEKSKVWAHTTGEAALVGRYTPKRSMELDTPRQIEGRLENRFQAQYVAERAVYHAP